RVKGSAARLYLHISARRMPVGNVKSEFPDQGLAPWNDANRDLVFQPGEQTGAPVITSGTTTTVDPGYRRPYTDEYAGGIDRDLGQNLKLSVVATYRREKYPTATYNPAFPFATTLSTRDDTGPDGVVGTADGLTLYSSHRLA